MLLHTFTTAFGDNQNSTVTLVVTIDVPTMPANDRTALIRFFQSTYPSTDAIATEIASHFHPVDIPKGSFFLEAGRRSNEYLFLQEGFMRSYFPGITIVFLASAAIFLHILSLRQLIAFSTIEKVKITAPKKSNQPLVPQ